MMGKPFAPKTADATPLERRAALHDGDLRAALDRMIEIRVLEEHVQQLFLEGLIPGTTHTCQGQEAVCVAVAGTTRTTDRVLCTYRGHGWALALGMPAVAVLGEIMGRRRGCTGGLGGSMHLSDRALGLWPTVAIVGAQLPIAAGAALASQTRGDGAVTVAVFGDGAANIGAFHEALNLAGIWALPVVFVCENNLYAEYSRIDGTSAVPEIASRAAAYAMPGVAVDGQSLGTMRAAMREAVERARAGGGPTLIEAKTYRFVGHSRSDPAKYRLPGELEAWKARDPVRLVAAELQPGDPDALIAEVRGRWETTMASVVEAVKAAPEPREEDMFRHVYAGG
ncbi:MAG TPA: thiamine pyrophosphate-dependent dehydrogenase E1 component subunit alpha [bacterium]|nr:thiamine pyrophosphate-dependent dehydrogenase E1 component subunit alpha [bacterium]